MKLTKEKCFNPFFITVNDVEYQVRNIAIFDKEGIIAKTRSGWFGDRDNYFKNGLEIDCDCILKRKVNLETQTAFIISDGSDNYFHYCFLYIPNSVVELAPPEFTRAYDNRAFRKVQKSLVYKGVEFVNYTFVDEKINEIKSKINFEAETLTQLYATAEFLEEKIEVIKGLIKELKDAQEEMKNMTVEEFLRIEAEKENR